MKTPAEIWKRVLKLLERDVTPVTLSTWFEDSAAVDFKDNLLVIHTQSSFKREIIEKRFLNLIKDALKELFSSEIEVKILCGDKELESYTSSSREICEGITNEYTFERFVVGSSNRFAHAAAIAVSKNPASSYNPLVIYGQSGLGKTHLLYAIANEIMDRYPHYKVVYIKGDDFTNDLISSIQAGAVNEFRNKYRMADLLLVDDIQFIAGKERTQEEFFHTFNTLHEANKQIVLTSDRPPNEINTLEERLKTRFVWGLLADIQPPDYETRMAIIMAKANKLNLALPEDVMQYIAGTITNNVRQLEGAVKKIVALHELMNQEIDISLAEHTIKDIFKENPGLKPTPNLIIKEVASFFNITPDKLISLNRAKETVIPRQIAMFLVRELTELSLLEIGREFDRDHSTVIHSINKIEELVKTNTEYQNTIKNLKKNIRNQ